MGNHEIDAKVAFFTGYIPPYALPVFQELNRRISRLSIFLSTTMEGNRQWSSDWGELDVRVQSTMTHKSKWRHRIGFSDTKETHIPFDTLRQLRIAKPDVIISEELGYRSLLCSLYQLAHPATPLILVCNLSEHTEQNRGAARLLLRKLLSKRATITTVNGESGRRYLVSQGFDSARIHSFPYTHVPGKFETVPLNREREGSALQLLSVGELSERKGILPFLEQLCVWCQRNATRMVKFRLIGSGPLEEAARTLNLPPNLTLEVSGYQDYDRVSFEMGCSDLLIFPTLADEWGMVVNESLAAGLPVLGSRYSQAAEELLKDGVNGWIFDPTDINDVQEILNAVLALPLASLDDMRIRCRESIAERTPQWAASKMISAIRSALEEKRV